jgi:hypothetical protein
MVPNMITFIEPLEIYINRIELSSIQIFSFLGNYQKKNRCSTMISDQNGSVRGICRP